MPTFHDTYTLENVEVIEERTLCIRILTDEGDNIFIPKSQIDDMSDVFNEGDTGNLTISMWMAKEKGLI